MGMWKKTNWYLLKLPSMLILMVLGFFLEYLFTFPFVIAYYLDRLTNRKLRP
jgi:hypothetical protein